MAKRKRNKQAKRMMESLILGSYRLFWIGEETEIYLGKSVDSIIDTLDLQKEAYDPVYGASFGAVSPWRCVWNEAQELNWERVPLIVLARQELRSPFEEVQAVQLTSLEWH
ncbi:hypothetical protein A6E13_16490 [Aliivibrio fischeri]|uniref:hypothetical protein n=1 Tax=Aliivibrio fischeri TaxID=668 RepID=UPI00080DB9D2|nr:hypothetical protein [Aliivibrio fischeri]OCH31820.1 hypothetical protein A6E13_16490 [Aliivibrio fischeri]